MSGKAAHICDITDERLRSRLARNAEVVCSICGAGAHRKASVCKPVPLEPDH